MNIPPLIAIGLDAADPVLLERWMDAGLLPTLAKIRAAGTYTRLAAFDFCRAESACTTFLTGCAAWTTGRWTGFRFHKEDYTVDELDAYEFDEYPPFYSLAESRRIAVFDLPQTRMAAGVNGIQVLGWGAHAPHTPRTSSPEGLLDELTARHGEHPTYDRDYCALWDGRTMRWMKEGLLTGISRRASICRELLQRERWDLFLTFFGETHSAGHYFYHLSQPHPLPRQPDQHGDWILDIFQAVDRALQEILTAAPPDTRVLLFSDHGMEPNSTDYRAWYSCPSCCTAGAFRARLVSRSAPRAPFHRPSCRREIVRGRTKCGCANTTATRSRARCAADCRSSNSITASSGVSESMGCRSAPRIAPSAISRQCGIARLAADEGVRAAELLRGVHQAQRQRPRRRRCRRPDAVPATCDEIERLLRQVRNARTGSPMFRKMMRSRTSALEEGPTLPDPICWCCGRRSLPTSWIHPSDGSVQFPSTGAGATSNGASCWRVDQAFRCRAQSPRHGPWTSRPPSSRCSACPCLPTWTAGRCSSPLLRVG